MSIYTNFKNLTDAELEQEEYRFNAEISNAELADEALQELGAFFAQNPDSKEKYRYSYWRWFVILSWQKALSASDTFFLKLISEQVPVAILTKIDVSDLLMRYLAENYYTRTDIGNYFIKLKKAFLESEAVVGVWQGKNVTVAETIKEIDSVYKSDDSLAQADFESRLLQIMFPADEASKKYLITDHEQAKEEFLDLVSFFETFTEENIWYVVDGFLNPEKYQNAAPGQPPVATTVPSTPATKPAPVPQSKPVTPAPPAPKPTTPVQPTPAPKPSVPVKPPASTKPALAQIKSEIESQFKKDADGNFEDIATVLAMLSTLSEKYNDPKIADMLYFDEKDNKFKWNA